MYILIHKVYVCMYNRTTFPFFILHHCVCAVHHRRINMCVVATRRHQHDTTIPLSPLIPQMHSPFFFIHSSHYYTTHYQPTPPLPHHHHHRHHYYCYSTPSSSKNKFLYSISSFNHSSLSALSATQQNAQHRVWEVLVCAVCCRFYGVVVVFVFAIPKIIKRSQSGAIVKVYYTQI